MRQSPSRNKWALRLAAVLAAAAPAALLPAGPSSRAVAQAGGYAVQQPPRQDAAAEAWAQILAKTPQSNDAALAQRVRTVGDRLVRAAGADPRGWDYRVFSDNSPNAFVLPGGRVGVNTGLFRVIQSDDQLAAVLGHEIAHNQYNHAGQRSTRTGLAQLGVSIGARVFGRNDPELPTASPATEAREPSWASCCRSPVVRSLKPTGWARTTWRARVFALLRP